MIDLNSFFERQFQLWPEVALRFSALENVEIKEVGGYRVQFNPARAVSTAAKVDSASIAARPCFLCDCNRPKEQISMPWGDLEILVNPFPIFPGHLTIAAKTHVAQSLLGRTEQMRRLSKELPGYTVFYNGAKCGASAPDHMHFQAVPSRYMRIPRRFYTYRLSPAEFCAEEIDPMINAVCTDGEITIIPRVKHRPDCYGDLLVSPAAIDLCGTLISVRKEDFLRLNAETVDAILKEVTFNQPPVYVGLITDKPHINPEPDDTTSVDGIVIGKNFHWERRQTQRFRGEILQYDNQIINRIGVEDYLCSVISSEMSAMSSLELLKAHAVISRSWLLSQMRATRALADKGSPCVQPELAPDEVSHWFDSDDHSGFDVCSDDHCQRYQGITRISSTNAFEAVRATQGMVLTADGRICDARFSKCCGGVMERFQTCWQPSEHSYLVARADSPSSFDFPDLTIEENARAWILSRPEAFCSDTPIDTLKQVLNDFDISTTPDFYRWKVRYSQRRLSDLVMKRSGIDFGLIHDLIPLDRGTSGRIFRLKIVGEKRSLVVGKELMIRRWLSDSHLYSSAFIVEREGDDFILHGAGWGHGVGMCQIGAAMMAEKGCDFRKILSHYYPGSELIKFY